MLNKEDIRVAFSGKFESLCFGECGIFDNRRAGLGVVPAFTDGDDHLVELVDDLDLFVQGREAFHSTAGSINL